MYSRSHSFNVTCSVRLKTLYPLLTSLQTSMNVPLVIHVIAVHRVRIQTDHMYVPVTEATPVTGTPVEVRVYFTDISAVFRLFVLPLSVYLLAFLSVGLSVCLSLSVCLCLSVSVCLSLSFLLYVSLSGNYFRHFFSVTRRILTEK